MTITRLLVVGIVLLFSLAACETDTQSPTITTDTTAVTTDTLGATTTGEATVEGTNAALENGVTQLSAPNALSNIDGWISRLEGAEFEQRDEIVNGLQDLRSTLQETPIDGDRVASILRDLGEWTTQAGTDANNQQVQRLGQLLTQNAVRLETGATAATGNVGTGPGTGTPTGTGTVPNN